MTPVSRGDCYPRYRFGCLHRPRRGQRADGLAGRAALLAQVSIRFFSLSRRPSSCRARRLSRFSVRAINWGLQRQPRIGQASSERGTQSRGKARFSRTSLRVLWE